MIKETNQRIVKVHFKDDGFWDNELATVAKIFIWMLLTSLVLKG